MEISIFIYLHIHIHVHVADGGHLRRYAGEGPQKASLEQVHSTVEMVIYHSFVMVAILASMAIELNIDCNI